MPSPSRSTRALVAGGIAFALAAAPLASWAAVRATGVTSPVAVPGSSTAPRDPVVDLDRQLSAGTAADRAVAFVHGDSARLAELAATSSGLQVIDRFTRIGVVAAYGAPAQLRAAALQAGVRRVELDRPIQLTLDTSHVATRGEDALRGFTGTTTETVVTGKAKKKKPQQTATVTRAVSSAPLDGSGVSIAVIDSGVDGTHPLFVDAEGNSKVVRNLKNVCVTGVLLPLEGPCVGEEGDAIDETFVDVPTNDSDTGSAGGHGTHVAGIAGGGYGALSDGRPLHGAAPGAKLVALSVGATLSVYGGSAGMNWVLEHHAQPCGPDVDAVACPPIKVVNNSWGAGGGDYDPETVEAKLQDALVAEGVTVVWAAGNDGGDGTSIEIYGPNLTPTPGVLSVANYDDENSGTRDGALDPSSSRGLSTDPRSYPDLSAPGATIDSSCRPWLPICYGHASTGDGNQLYYNLGGTSMAAPHVAGIVAQLLQADPTLTPAEIEDVLEDTAHEFTAGAAYVTDPRNADGTTSFDKGHGLVDVKAAVARIRGITLDDTTTGPASPCAASVVAVDATDDATEPTVDVTGAAIEVARDAAGAVTGATFTIDAPELAEEYPSTYNGYSFYVDVTVDGRPYYVGASRDMFNGESFSFGRPDPNASNIRSDMTSVGMTGSFTYGEGLSITLTQAAIDDANTTLAADQPAPTPPLPPLADGLVLGQVTVVSTLQRNAVVVASLPAGDSADSGCTYTVGSGSAPNPPDAGGGDPTTPPPPPPAEEVDGTLSDGGSWEASGTSPTDNTAYECTGPNDPNCVTYVLDLRPSTGEGTLDITLESDTIGTVIDDFDVFLYDLEGHEVATSGNPQTVLEGFSASITSGLYYLVVQPYTATTDSPYTVTASLA